MVAMVTVLSVLYCVVVVCCGVRIPSDPMLLIIIPQEWESVGDAFEANYCLRSLDIDLPFESSHELPVMIKGLCRNERLTELSIGATEVQGMYRVSIVVLN